MVAVRNVALRCRLGRFVADAYLAALAVESGCTWVTTDRDYASFHGPRLHNPLV